MFKIGDHVILVRRGAIPPEISDYTGPSRLSIGNKYTIIDVSDKKGTQWVRINESRFWFVSEHFKLVEKSKYVVDFNQDDVDALTALSWHVGGVRPTRDVFTTDWGTDDPLYCKYATIDIVDHNRYVISGSRLEILKNVGEKR